MQEFPARWLRRMDPILGGRSFSVEGKLFSLYGRCLFRGVVVHAGPV